VESQTKERKPTGRPRIQLEMFKPNLPLPRPRAGEAFDGDTYSERQDHVRLEGQLQAVYKLMQDGAWRTLARICKAAGGSEAGCSARLRDLRKDKYGGHTVERRRVGESGLYEYQLLVNRGGRGGQG
jgi:hypothetical protein